MKKLLLMLCFFNSTILLAQEIVDLKNNINNTVTKINKEKNTVTKYVTNVQYIKLNNNAGTVKGVFKNKECIKIIRVIGTEYNYIIDEYFLKNEKLIYVSETQNNFEYNDTLATYDYEKIGLHFSGSYWFNDNKEIDEISTGHNRFEGDEADAEKDFLADVKKYLALLKSKSTIKKSND
jgi:hypothetical protein